MEKNWEIRKKWKIVSRENWCTVDIREVEIVKEVEERGVDSLKPLHAFQPTAVPR